MSFCRVYDQLVKLLISKELYDYTLSLVEDLKVPQTPLYTFAIKGEIFSQQ